MQGAPDPGSAAAEIEFRGVTKRYPGREAPAVRGLSLNVPAGEICVLIGPSGSGKTTAMKMVNRLIDITEGDITIGGAERAQPRPDRAAAAHRLRLPADRPVPAHERRGQHRHRAAAAGVERSSASDARVGELLELVGLEQSDARRYPGQFSGGQRQRIGVARAMAAGPADHAHGRAVRRRRPDRARPPAERLPAAARRGPQDGHLRDARHRRGDQDGRPGRDPRRDGELVQYGTPDEILASPANEFVADFVGADRGLKRLLLRELRDIELSRPTAGRTSCRPSTSARACATRSRSWSPAG